MRHHFLFLIQTQHRSHGPNETLVSSQHEAVMRLSGEIPLRITVSVSGTSYALGRSDRFGSHDQKHSEQFRVPEST